MMNRKKIFFGFVGLVIAVPLLAFAIVRAIESSYSGLPYYADDLSKTDKIDAKRVHGFSFINQDSAVVSGDFVKGRVWVACYFFTTCPGICPVMMDGMRSIQREFEQEDKLRLLSFTVDPEVDRPDVLKHYAAMRSVRTDQWSFLTGQKHLLYRFARKELKLTATDGDGGSQDFIHSDRLVLIDQENYIRGYYDGTEPTDVRQLAMDIRKLLK